MLRDRVGAEGEQVVAEFRDDGHSGARLDRPGLDALRDAAEAGLIERVWCLSPDRLARVYAYQVILLDELARHGVGVRFTDAPPLDDDPQAKLLTQVQGVIAEYERAKIADGTGAGSCSAPAPGRCWPGAPPTAIGAGPATRTARPGWRCSNPKPRSCGGSSTTISTADTRCARSSAGWPPTRSRPRPAATGCGAPPR